MRVNGPESRIEQPSQYITSVENQTMAIQLPVAKKSARDALALSNARLYPETTISPVCLLLSHSPKSLGLVHASPPHEKHREPRT